MAKDAIELDRGNNRRVPAISSTGAATGFDKRSRTMLSKTTLALALISTVITLTQAQAQQHVPGAPPSFNGLVWDPPIQGSVTPDAVIHPPSRSHSRGRFSLFE